MSHYIPEERREAVVIRAGHKCEYCKFPQAYSFFPFHIEHVIAVKHGGGHSLHNLALACPHCNLYKGTDLTTVLPDNLNEIIPIFNPRKDKWENHFDVKAGLIIPKTVTAIATIKLQKLNEPERVIIRKILEDSGRYP